VALVTKQKSSNAKIYLDFLDLKCDFQKSSVVFEPCQ
jgi:hypothetical protein